MVELSKRMQMPAFGHWEYFDDLPITQYFESALQAGLLRSNYRVDEDLFKVPAAVEPVYHSQLHNQKVRSGGGEKQHRRNKSRVSEIATEKRPRERLNRAPKAVDEDLYKIPPELLSKTTKRKRMLRYLVPGCLGLNCIA